MRVRMRKGRDIKCGGGSSWTLGWCIRRKMELAIVSGSDKSVPRWGHKQFA